jgi:hypothetical protein
MEGQLCWESGAIFQFAAQRPLRARKWESRTDSPASGSLVSLTVDNFLKQAKFPWPQIATLFICQVSCWPNHIRAIPYQQKPPCLVPQAGLSRLRNNSFLISEIQEFKRGQENSVLKWPFVLGLLTTWFSQLALKHSFRVWCFETL